MRATGKVQVVAVGVSAGGPAALQTLLSGLPTDFPVPILVVQHIAPGFLDGLVTWLSQATGFAIHIAKAFESALPGHVYFAPDGQHLGITAHQVLTLSAGEASQLVCPSVSHLFRSVAQSFGAAAVGVLLTGMGRDGADELKLMKERGAYTIAQDAESSVVHGMPAEAIKIGAAGFILSLERIPMILGTLVQRERPSARLANEEEQCQI